MEELDHDQNLPIADLIAIKFDLLTSAEMEKLSSASIVETSDVTTSRLGLPNGASQCATCGSNNVRDCDGHFGVIKLPATIYHPYFIAEVIQILNQICPGCVSLKQSMDMKDSSVLESSDESVEPEVNILKAHHKNLNGSQKRSQKLCKPKHLTPAGGVLVDGSKVKVFYLKKSVKIDKMLVGASNQSSCKYCSKNATKLYPSVIFKMTSRRDLSIVAEVLDKAPNKFKSKGLHQVLPQDYWDFVPHDNQQHQSQMTAVTLSPYQVFHLLKKLDPEFINQFASRRELLFLSCLPVTPNCHRVVEMGYGHSDGPRLSFDERTKAYKRMIDVSRRMDDFRQHPQFSVLASSFVTNRVIDCLNSSKLYSKKTDGESSMDVFGMKWLKDVILSKRSDNAFRSIMVGDPKISLCEIGIPINLALNLVVSEHVNSYNFDNLNLNCNAHLLAKEELHIRRNGKLISVRKANQLKIGDIAYRPLQNGDLVLINRPPSVHQHSLIALSAKILPIQSVVSINPLCCAPFLGDFDGDCLHGYVPQSIRSRVELGQLVSLRHQLLNAQDGRSLVSLTHDSLAAAHLLTSTEVFLKKYELQQLEMLCSSESPVPSIIKSMNSEDPLWTGKQLFGMLLPPGLDFSMDQKMLHIINSEMLTSPLGSSWLQNSSSGLFSVMFKHCGSKSLDFLSSAQDVLCEYLSMRGLSVSLSDLYLFSDHYSRRKLTEEVNLALDEAEEAFQIKQLLLNPTNIPFLKYYDESDDLPSNDVHSHLIQNNQQIIRSSIMSFKDVFSDVLRMVHQHVSKQNSMLVMINAGSKGNMLKFVQQTACLGIQLPASKFPFKIPPRLSCFFWNKQKYLEYGMDEDITEGLGGQNSYAVIRSSFVEGLNPLECLLHAISGRANFFSENAEVPGTLTRKLMYHLRDLYVAYDGTVRSSYGQQIVQFSYDTSDDMYCDYDQGNRLGAPVGSWAACSISEAAYGALDHPVNGLEDSPLMNLKEVLKCDKGRNSMDHVGLLFLSKHLKKYRYGLEYASLEVKNHLEHVYFSDLVDTVMILYDGCDVRGTRRSPWVTHFHLCQEIMKTKRLGLEFIIEELTVQYNSTRNQSNDVFPSILILKGNCSVVDEFVKHNQTCCITVVAQTSDSNSMLQLDIVKNRVIPSLLASLLKGFLEFKDVEIQCQQDCGLLVKVSMSEHCKSGKFWATLQNACVPIMELIDWERSQPESVHDIFCSYGIDSAWRHFVESLRSATSDTGRNVRREHLMAVADCLSLSGEFLGLSSQGLKQQRNQLTISSPFSQACFSNPAHSFVNAAKQCSVDNLCGILDAIAWGKEPSVGTAGPFDILHSGKSHQPEQNENIYEFLHNLEALDFEKNCTETCKSSTEKVSKWRSICQSIGHIAVANGCRKVGRNGTLTVEQKYLDAKVGMWDNIVDMHTNLQNILREYPLDGTVKEPDKSCLIEALKFHPKGDEKIGAGIREIKIGQSLTHPGSRCFILLRNDDSSEDFSYWKCVLGAAKYISPELERFVEKKLHQRKLAR